MTFLTISNTTIPKFNISITRSPKQRSNPYPLCLILKAKLCLQRLSRSHLLCSCHLNRCLLILPLNKKIRLFHPSWTNLTHRMLGHWVTISLMKVTTKHPYSNNNLKMSQCPLNNILIPLRLHREAQLPIKRHLHLSWSHNISTNHISLSNSLLINPIQTSLRRTNLTNTTKLVCRTIKISKIILGKEVPTNPTLRKWTPMTTPSNNSSTSLLATDHPPSNHCKLTLRPLHHRNRQEPLLQSWHTRSDLTHRHLSPSTREAKVMHLWIHRTSGTSSNRTGASLGNSLSSQRVSMIISCQQTSIHNSRCWKINSIANLTRTLKNVLPKYKRTLKDTRKKDNMFSLSSKIWPTWPLLGEHPSSRSSDHWWLVLRLRLVIWTSLSQG